MHGENTRGAAAKPLPRAREGKMQPETAGRAAATPNTSRASQQGTFPVPGHAECGKNKPELAAELGASANEALVEKLTWVIQHPCLVGQAPMGEARGARCEATSCSHSGRVLRQELFPWHRQGAHLGCRRNKLERQSKLPSWSIADARRAHSSRPGSRNCPHCHCRSPAGMG